MRNYKLQKGEKMKSLKERMNEELLAKNANRRSKCVVYTRVMGYHRPVESFNLGKQGEHREREHFIA